MDPSSHAIATYKVQPQKPDVRPYGKVISSPRGSFVLLHGWDSKGSDMVPLCDAIKQLPSAAGWNFYTPTYETHTETFVQAAQDLLPQIGALKQPLILFGYSEGGIVARQLIADGLKIKALVTICGPHLGLGVWIPTAGSASLSPFSNDLKQLNNSAIDKACRHLFHLFAITCTDAFGYHADDGVVPEASALGTQLGPVAERATIRLDYGNAIAGVDPHMRGMDSSNLQPVIDACSKLL
jgi:pimeloyl-ACP methyl ester carboxylesterase